MYARKYIYERADWPELSWDERALHDVLRRVYLERGLLLGKLDALGFEVRDDAILKSVSAEIVKSSQIEGEFLDITSVRSSVAKKLGIEVAGMIEIFPDHYTEGVIEMSLDATQNYAEAVTDERLFGWHTALFPMGRSGIQRIRVGAYRTESMEIVSGALGKERVHYAAPDARRVPLEMKRYLKWLNAERDMDPYVKAAIAHLRFESIHPFDDGNGRIGRALSDLLLARAENNPDRYYSLSAQLMAERKEYYDALEWAQRMSGDVTEWIGWFLGCVCRAMESSTAHINEAAAKARLFERWRKIPFNERQLDMVNRMIDGFEGKVTSSKWAKITKCSHDTALRDINDLVDKGVLRKSDGGGRSTSYVMEAEGGGF
ncbi:MAG: Fic family protein [Clostridiales Family XIII bacterium]|jgi:Fic family protein|nr:Fic family protein [Clostridiales Family XIII bacterium]